MEHHHQFEYHTFLHHSQTKSEQEEQVKVFEYHTFLHHSQTYSIFLHDTYCLNTIHFYIILKLKFKNEPPSLAQNIGIQTLFIKFHTYLYL